MTFDPKQHLIQLKGRNGKLADYLPVAARLAWFRDVHPDGVIEINEHTVSEQVAIFRARVSIPSGGSADGWGSETPQDFRDYIEKGSTKALGRALAAMGFGAMETGDEMDEGERIADSPVERPQRGAPRNANGYQVADLGPAPASNGTPAPAAKPAAPANWTTIWATAKPMGIPDRAALDAFLAPDKAADLQEWQILARLKEAAAPAAPPPSH